VRGYLQRAFGADLDAAQVAMRTLAEVYSPEELADQAYGLYVEFRCVRWTIDRDVVTCACGQVAFAVDRPKRH